MITDGSPAAGHGVAGPGIQASVTSLARWWYQRDLAERTSQRRLSAIRRRAACAHVSLAPLATRRWKFDGTRDGCGEDGHGYDQDGHEAEDGG